MRADSRQPVPGAISGKRPARWLLPLFTIFCLSILIASFSIYHYFLQQERAEMHMQLGAIAQMKAGQIENWLQQRRGDAEVLANDPLLAQSLVKYLRGGADSEAGPLIVQRLEAVRRAYHYLSIQLLDQQANLQLIIGEDMNLSLQDLEKVRLALSTGQIIYHDLHWEPGRAEHSIQHDIVIPLALEDGQQRDIVAVLHIHVDVEDFLFPLIQRWPLLSASGESLLVRIEADDVEFMNNLRFKDDAAFTLRLPLSTPDLPAAKALRGMEGVLDGRDYRGIEVVATARKIAGTDWILLAKIDQQEIYAPIRTLITNVIAITVVLLGSLTLVFYTWRRSIDVHHEAALYQAELQQLALGRHFDYLTRYANDIILLADDDGVIIEANDRALESYQYNRGELLGMNILELDGGEGDNSEAMTLSASQDGLVFETLHRRQDGTLIPVEVSMRSIKVEQHSYRQLIIRDITERSQAQEKLRASEQRFQLAIESANEGIWDSDIATGKEWWSPHYYELLGYRDGEIESSFDQFLQLVHADDRERIAKAIRLHKQQRQPYAVELRMRMKSGDYRWFRASGQAQWNEAGEVVRMLGALQDIHQARMAELAVIESQQRLQSFFNAGLIGMTISTSEKKWLDVNDTFCRNLGYSREELLNMDWTDITHADDLEDSVRQFERVLAGEIDSYSLEKRFIRKDGSFFPAIIAAKCIRLADRTVDYFVTFIMDISERRALERKEISLGNIIQRSMNEVYIFAADTLKFIEVNAGARRNTGYSMEELAVMSPQDLKPEYTAASFSELLRPLRDAEQDMLMFETVHQRKDGSRYPVLVQLQLLAYQDTQAFVAFVLDISEKLMIEKMLKQSQKLESIGQLTGGLAHDFNNLLGILQGCLDILRHMHGGEAERQKWLDKALDAVRRGAVLTGKMLSFSQVRAVKSKTHSINTLLKGMSDMIRVTLTPAITFTLEASADLWLCNINADEFEDVIINMVVNARDAMMGSGTLLIETSNKVLDKEYARLNPGARPGQYVLVSISDTGTGMSEQVLAQLFEPFFTTKDVGKGSGLGMSMVYGFMRRSRGHIKVYSDVGHGTTMRLYLPRSQAEESEQQTDTPVDMVLPRGSETVLVVDDEEELLEIARVHLESLGYRVILAANAVAALQLLRSKGAETDLLFTDVVMPGGMDGYALAKQVMQQWPSIKLLITSGFTDRIVRANGMASLPLTLLEKPYTRQELAFAVRDALDDSDKQA